MVAAGTVAAGAVSVAAAEPDLRLLLEQARAAGRDGTPVGKVSIAQATSQALVRANEIDFPISFDIDLALDARPVPLDKALTAPVEETGRFVVVFDVALAKASRKVRDVRDSDRTSSRVVDEVRHDNPAYRLAYRNFERAVSRGDPFVARGKPLPARIDAEIRTAQQRLEQTPKTLKQPVWGDYRFKLANLDGKKAMTVNTYVVDKVARRYVKSMFDVVEDQGFFVAYGLDPSDPNKDRLRGEYALEKDVRDWERAPVLAALSAILAQAAERDGKPFASGERLLAELNADRNAAIARYEAGHYDDRPLNDPRFDSVVAIYNLFGMGSGFFVRPNLVMTNWHVVKDSQIVELKLYDRRETFGQVIAKDVRLDLALVKVQDKGRPVEFYQGKGLKPGDAVDAIGHPRRHLFSITRGIVSAIRRDGEEKTDVVRKGADAALRGAEHRTLYVQTDAEINPGNSGGPLFAGNKVVGVNVLRSLEVVGGKDVVQNPGLAFAIHYSEAERFLQEALKGE